MQQDKIYNLPYLWGSMAQRVPFLTKMNIQAQLNFSKIHEVSQKHDAKNGLMKPTLNKSS